MWSEDVRAVIRSGRDGCGANVPAGAGARLPQLRQQQLVLAPWRGHHLRLPRPAARTAGSGAYCWRAARSLRRAAHRAIRTSRIASRRGTARASAASQVPRPLIRGGLRDHDRRAPFRGRRRAVVLTDVQLQLRPGAVAQRAQRAGDVVHGDHLQVRASRMRLSQPGHKGRPARRHGAGGAQGGAPARRRSRPPIPLAPVEQLGEPAA
jgi:hypothetical protein